MFLFETGAIQFLATHNYDFNRSFYDGVFYLSRENEKIMVETKRLNELRDIIHKMNMTADPDMLAFSQMYLPTV